MDGSGSGLTPRSAIVEPRSSIPEPAPPREGDAPAPRERRAAALAHASALLMFFLPFGNLLGPFLVFLACRGALPFAASHAAQSVLYQAIVSAAAWGLFLLGQMHGFGTGPHLAVLLLSLLPSAWAAAQALRGKALAYPWIGRRAVWS